jgi:hypothetical protein
MTTLMQIEEGEDRDLLLASLALADPQTPDEIEEAAAIEEE